MLARKWFEYKFKDSSLLPWKEKVTASIFPQDLSSLNRLFRKKEKKGKGKEREENKNEKQGIGKIQMRQLAMSFKQSNNAKSLCF